MEKIEKIEKCLKSNLENIKNIKFDIFDLEKKIFLFLEKKNKKNLKLNKRSLSEINFPSEKNNFENKNIFFLLDFFKNINLNIITFDFLKIKENAQILEKKIENYKKIYEMDLNEILNNNIKKDLIENTKIKKLEKKQLLIHEEISRFLQNYIFSTLKEILSKNNFSSIEISTENLIKSFLVFLKNIKKKLYESNYVILKKKNLIKNNLYFSDLFEQNLGEGINDIYDSHFHRDKDEKKYLFSYDIFFIDFVNGFLQKLIFK